jgi:hypothetical protein
MQLKKYSNRFASIEQQPCGGWIVWNEVVGLPLDERGLPCTGGVKPKIHATYATARETQLVVTNQYKAIR